MLLHLSSRILYFAASTVNKVTKSCFKFSENSLWPFASADNTRRRIFQYIRHINPARQGTNSTRKLARPPISKYITSENRPLYSYNIFITPKQPPTAAINHILTSTLPTLPELAPCFAATTVVVAPAVEMALKQLAVPQEYPAKQQFPPRVAAQLLHPVAQVPVANVVAEGVKGTAIVRPLLTIVVLA